MSEYLLEVRGINKSFPGVKALSDMHLDLRHGEVLALVGENGAGKSTLMKLLSGIDAPDSGTFMLNGELLAVSGPRQAQQAGISIIHQEFHLMRDLTVAQNIYIGREPRSGPFLNERALNRRAQELFDRIGIDLNPRQPVSQLTVARQQMVEIAKALSRESVRVLIMDEPTAALNDNEVAALHGLIRQFTTAETGVIYISHRMEELKAISQRITVIRDGEYVDTVDTAATSMREVISLMVGRQVETTQRPEPRASGAAPKLSVRGLSTKALLKDISFDLHPGEILGFAGLMGAGRTEVARAIVGADRIESGTITVHGAEVKISTPAAAAALGIGYLSEDRKHLGLMLDRSVAENIAVTALPKLSRAGFVDARAVRAQAAASVQQLRIKTAGTGQAAKNLSGGNQQKVVIAKWLFRDCDVLIFDEPTRGIDVGAKDEIYNLLNTLADAGKSIIMISSELPEVLRMSHRIAVMSEGRITGILENAEATQENIMELATRGKGAAAA